MEIEVNKSRFSDAPWFQIGPQHIVVGGAGGIGSWVTLFLSRIGHILYVYDMDTIDETNMAGQLYMTRQIGINKAEATKSIATDFSKDSQVNTFGEYTEEGGLVSPIMVSCFDNMKARKLMFEKWAALEERELFVDGRMLAEVGNVIVVQKGEEDKYRTLLFSDEEIEEAPCSFKATSHCGALIASLMTNGINTYLNNKHVGVNIRPIVFKLDFELPLSSFMEDKVSLEIITN